MIQQQEIDILLAEIYYNSAKSAASLDMRKITDILETLRPHFTGRPVFDIWKHIRLDAADLDNEQLIRVLMQLKYDYHHLIYKTGVQEIEQITTQDPEAGFQAWLRLYADAIIHWESHVYDRIDDVDFQFSPEHRQYLRESQKFHDYVRDNRWADCYERYRALAANNLLLPMQQAMLHAICGQIQLYYLDMSVAREHLETARKIAPHAHAKIERCFGEWHLKNQEFDTARMFMMNAMSIDISDADTYLAMGDSYRDERKWDLAAEYYTKAISVNPLETSPFDRLIYIYGEPELFKDKVAEITRMVQQIELRNFNIPDKRFSNWRYNGYRAMGWVYYRNELYTDAAVWYNKAIKLQPGWASAYIDLGNTYYAAQDIPAAKKQYDKAEQVASDSYDVCWIQAWYFEQEQDFPTAISYYQKCIALRPHTAKSTQLIIADIYSGHLKDFEKAQSILLDLAQSSTLDPLVYEKLAAVYGKTGDLNNSELWYRKALDIHPGSANNWNEVGVARYRQSDFEEAAICFQKAIALNTTEPVYYGNLADAYFNAGLLDAAKSALEQGTTQFPEDAELWNRLGNFLFDQQQYQPAAVAYQRAVNLQPEQPIFQANLGGAWKILDNWESAAVAYQKATELAPENDYYWNELGIIAFQQDQITTAAACFRKATELNTKDAVYFDNLAQACGLLPDRQQEAETALLKATELAPNNDTLLNRTGNFYLQLGEYQQALVRYEQALALQPQHPIYLANTGYTYLLLEQPEKAEPFLEQSIRLNPDLPQTHIWWAQVTFALGNAHKAATYVLEKMETTGDPVYLNPFLQLYGEVKDDELGQKAIAVIENSPLLKETYQNLYG